MPTMPRISPARAERDELRAKLAGKDTTHLETT
jgi:hypothetical protein